jgi:xanthine dehydrogenase large subunit
VVAVVARELGLPTEAVRITATDTSKVPNTSATAASSGSDLNGMAAQAAARTLRERLVEFVRERHGIDLAAGDFAAGRVRLGARSISFAELVEQAYQGRVSLSATGYYRTPKIHWDMTRLEGRPFFYFACGAAVVEAVVDLLTGESRLLAVDILHDVGNSLNPAVDLGQIEGGFLQGVGWLTSEELCWSADGALTTHAPSTYKIPTAADWPAVSRIRLFDRPNAEATIYRSKAVGEPPLMLAIAAFHAIRDAVASAPAGAGRPRLMAPATPEAVLCALS